MNIQLSTPLAEKLKRLSQIYGIPAEEFILAKTGGEILEADLEDPSSILDLADCFYVPFDTACEIGSNLSKSLPSYNIFIQADGSSPLYFISGRPKSDPVPRFAHLCTPAL